MLSCVSNVLQTEREVEVRQAALIVLKLSIRSLTKDEVEVISSHEIKYVCSFGGVIINAKIVQ